MQIKLICQICDEIVAVFDTDEIKLPIMGEMFKPKDPTHDDKAPFFPGCDFEFMRCPYGAHRPMILPDKILTDKGLLNLSPDGKHLFTPYDKNNERAFILDRDQIDRPIPIMSDEEAEKLARIQIQTNELGVVPRGTQMHIEGDKIIIIEEANIIDQRLTFGGMAEDGKTDTQPEQQKNNQSVEKEKETSQGDDKRPSRDKQNYCAECNKQFRNSSGYLNHMRIKHKITDLSKVES